MLAGLPDLETDQHGRVVGSGLTLRPTPHRFTIAGRQLYTWCALDTLIFPAILGQAATVQSPCRTTGATVRLAVDPQTGVTDLEPATAGRLHRQPHQQASIQAAFCNQIHFLCSHTAARSWIDEHAGMTALSVADTHRLGQSLVPALLAPSTRTDCP